MTHSSPSFTASVVNIFGSDPACGSVIEKHEKHSPFEQRLEVHLLLLVGAVVGDDLGVAGVGGGGAEHVRRPVRAAEDLVDQRQLELAETLAAEFGPEVRGPQAAGLHLLAQRADVHPEVALERVVRELRIEQVERRDLLVAELADPLQLCFEFRIGTEIPGHGATPLLLCDANGGRRTRPLVLR